MSQRVVILLAIIVSLSFLGLLGGIYAVVKYKPTWVGLPANPQDTVKVNVDTTYVKPTIEVTQEDYEKFQIAKNQIKYLKFQKDSIIDSKIKVMDSLIKAYKGTSVAKEETKRIRDSLIKSRKDNGWLQDTLRKVADNFSKASKDKATLEKRVKEQEKFIEVKTDTVENKNFEEYAKIYENTNPAAVARVLEQLDERDAAKILKAMSKKKAGKVLEFMKSEKATTILLLGSQK